MKAKIVAAAVAAALLGLSSVASAQTSSAGASAGAGTGSPRCDSMTGADKDQCVRDENTKTEGSGPAGSAAGAATPGTSIGTGGAPAAAGASAESSAGTSRNCEALSGTEKADCLRKEGLANSGSSGGSADRAGPGSTGMGR
jgi:hypothetical protein